MTGSTVHSQFNPAQWDDTQGHPGCHMPKRSSALWMTDFVKPCVFMVRTPLGRLPFHFWFVRPCPHFINHNYPVQQVVTSFMTILFQTDMTSQSTPTATPHLNNVAPTWQQSCTFLSLLLKFKALLTHKSLYVQVIPSQSSAYLHPCNVQLWPLTCLCQQTQHVHC